MLNWADILKQNGAWVLLASVVVMYSYALAVRRNAKKLLIDLKQSDDPAVKERAVILFQRSKIWPPGHPWAPIALLLMAFQQFEIKYHWDIGRGLDLILLAVLFISSLMWIWTAIKDFRKASEAAKSVNK